jgi:hypothetical protein
MAILSAPICSPKIVLHLWTYNTIRRHKAPLPKGIGAQTTKDTL